jgi:hypothetical protein
MGKGVRLWCATQYDLSFDYQSFFDNNNVKYLIYGEELCPSTGREHHQVFIYFNNNKNSIKKVSKSLNNANCRQCDGNFEQNVKYCSKDGNVHEFGDRPKQGARTDLDALVNEVKEGLAVDDIAMNNPVMYHMYGRTLAKVEDITLRKKFRTWSTRGTWYWGASGVGKSHKAFENYDPDTHYVYPNDNGWWDGYSGQEIVIINEFRGWIQFSELLDLLDKYPKTVKRRCREPCPFLAKHIIITSSNHPKDVYSSVLGGDVWDEEESGEAFTQLSRRCAIVEMAQKCSKGNTGTFELFQLSPVDGGG